MTAALDSLAVAEGLDRALRARGTSAEVLIELDVGLGRAGVSGAAETLALTEGIERLAPRGGEQASCRACRTTPLPRASAASGSQAARPRRCSSHETAITETRASNYVFLGRSEAHGGWSGTEARCASTRR
jgi:D-serine deaminase-like pyridoxal phosphate-dependent protein